MNAEEIAGLIERLEAATGPDRQLDASIVRALCPNATIGDYVDFEDIVFGAPEIGIADRGELPLFTSSVDAARLILDEKALWATGSMEDGPFARICWPNPDGTFVGGYYQSNGATPAIALCIAALKAQARHD